MASSQGGAKMDFFPYILDIMDAHQKTVAESQKKIDDPRPGFAQILDAEKTRRRLESLAQSQTAAPAKSEADKKQAPPDFSMYKLYLSLMLRLGGNAPQVSPADPNASTVLHESLKAWRSGSRQLFTRDSDLHSMPQYPVVRFKNN